MNGGRLTSLELVTPREFWQQCKTADWYFQFSDDKHAYAKGVAQMDDLYRIAETSPAYLEIYTKWKNYFENYDLKSRVEPPMPVEVPA